MAKHNVNTGAIKLPRSRNMPEGKLNRAGALPAAAERTRKYTPIAITILSIPSP